MSDLTFQEVKPQAQIRKLPEILINQIAAGEVVERPASVIKELIENSLDAGASQIEIELEDGGIEKIKVLDNGRGIFPEELELAVERHATSKISSHSDLEAIATFGFRGEALSSIASVAEVELISRTPFTPSGFRLIVRHGQVETFPKEVSAPQGTQVTVTGLFSKTPARLKFLRSPSTELLHCHKTIKELALGNPHTRFVFRHQERILGTWVTKTRKERFQECLKLSEDPLEIRDSREEMALEAYLLPPNHSLARSELYFFINGRPVRNRPFLAAIRTAYLEQAGPGREPVGVVYLDMKREWVDVNVHPQKWEVRCFNQESIYQWLLTVFRKRLSGPSRNSVDVPAHFFPQMGGNPSPSYSSSRPFRFLAQTHRALICEDDSGLIISSTKKLIQSHFHRTIIESLDKSSFNLKTLSPPLLCHLNSSQFKTMEKHICFLRDFGLEFENYGNNDFALRSYPSFQSEELLQDFLHWLCEQLNEQDAFKSKEHFARALSEYFSEVHSVSLSDLLDELSKDFARPLKSEDALIKRLSYNHLEGLES